MIDINESVMQFLLEFVVVGPLIGAAALLPAPPGLKGKSPEQAVLHHGVTVTGAVLIAAIALALGFDHDQPSKMQASTDISWIPALDVRIHLGIDGISLPLLVLTALLTFLCALYSYFKLPAGPSPKAFVSLLLVLESGTLATFAVLDLLLFFLAFEMVLIPMYFLIARWGGEQRTQAAWKFILYTLLGSVVMLLGLLLIGIRAGTFDMVALATDNRPELTTSVQVIAVLAIGIGLAVKTPMWPLHSWLPDAHTAAPTVGSVLLAGVLLKMGTYGFVRILLPIAPDGFRIFAPYLAAFAVVGIIYGSLACLALAKQGAKGDLKRLIAYSSVGHMGFVLLGIATMTPTGVNGALFANIAHGLITGLLFFLVGALKDRTGTTDLDSLSLPSPDHRPSTSGSAAPNQSQTGAALYGKAPRLGGLLAFGAVASLGLPGLAGFWGEMLALFGAFEPAADLNRPAFLTFMTIAAFGTLLTAAYMLIVVRRVCMGAAPQEGPRLADVQTYEFAAWTPLVALTVLAGLWPAALLGLTDPAVQQLLAGGTR
ncbi:NADH-quinone oxidoreductase subunit M [Streptomyces ipomoeae]|uniref:NADH-ubiquinone/plastoquinone oxidoreductase, subunit 4 family protein n=1 Tax=Streptomyces ipomoeae 91-03 TaxID=698759 RepID=L1L4G1_9ACTN|nr:NADH-quinone oxidoreductase subunit M [Streptomyces ipomoeae]EKX67946.1 NADH-ubiquinone/plastoquinone oxidoreductase, subunit 4 family protein [Streptomyces ipomoeae 91-03]MDX2699273.1 NADH-quinone oxidoreductase subunit M [Streptomyces ipomoeae]MDX2844975.1 NADH-quinone oxidoreductase subunit M [Streptomyces ipomoeae]